MEKFRSRSTFTGHILKSLKVEKVERNRKEDTAEVTAEVTAPLEPAGSLGPSVEPDHQVCLNLLSVGTSPRAGSRVKSYAWLLRQTFWRSLEENWRN